MKKRENGPSLLSHATTQQKVKMLCAILGLILCTALLSAFLIHMIPDSDTEPADDKEETKGISMTSIQVSLANQVSFNISFQVNINFEADTLSFLPTEGYVLAIDPDDPDAAPILVTEEMDTSLAQEFFFVWILDRSEDQRFVRLEIHAENALAERNNAIHMALLGDQYAFLSKEQYQHFSAPDVTQQH